MTLRPAVLVLGLTLCAAALGQVGPGSGADPQPADPEVAALKSEFEFGHYKTVLERANARLDRGGLSEADLVTLHEYAGLAAFNVNQRDQAERHFQAALRVDPDLALDPFAVPPPAIALFEQVRARLQPELRQIREERRLRAERQRQEAEERALAARETELQRRRLEDFARRTVQRVDHHSYIVNFAPFGIGQFEEGRVGWGVGFAVSEGVLAGASILAFWVYQLSVLNHSASFSFANLLPGNGPVPANQLNTEGVPQGSIQQAEFWRSIKTYSGIGFYAVYVVGVVDSLIHYVPQTITTVVQDQPVPPPAPAAPAPAPRPHAGLFLVPGGAGASLTLHF